MRCRQSSLGVGELQRWAEEGGAEQSRHPARSRSLPKPTKGLSAEHLKFNLHAGVSVPVLWAHALGRTARNAKPAAHYLGEARA